MVKMIVATTGGTNFMHEGFNVDEPSTFSRPWFAWVNSLFSELMVPCGVVYVHRV